MQPARKKNPCDMSISACSCSRYHPLRFQSAMPSGSGSKDKLSSSADPQFKALSSDTPKETIRFKERAQDNQESSGLPVGHQEVSFGPPGLTPQPKVKSYLCFPESMKVTRPVGAQCQYCHDYCCRSSQGHVSHRCAQHSLRRSVFSSLQLRWLGQLRSLPWFRRVH